MTDSAGYALHRPELLSTLGVGEGEIAKLMSGSAREWSANRVLIEANREHAYVYRLVRGWACRTRTLKDGRDQCILIFLPGDLFAVKSMFVRRHPDAVRTLSRCVVESVHHTILHRHFRENPDVAERCMWQVVEEERRLHNWVVGLGQGNAEERVAMLLIDFYGRLQKSGNIATNARKFRMPLTQTQLADHLGITPIHVNRVLRSYRERGILQVREGEVSILDLETLASIALPLLDVYERNSPEYVGPGPASDAITT
jgi:CRP/FNR family transcriptional regulator, anaerobic regulatory protein